MTAAVLAGLLLAQVADFNAQGMKALEAGDYAAAAEAFRKLVTQQPGDYAAHFHLGLAYSLLQKTDEAIAEYQKVLELKPGLYEAQLNLGILWLEKHQPAEALRWLEQALAQKPGEFAPNYYSGEALRELNRPAEAVERYRHALEANPKSAAAEVGLARALVALGQIDQAATHYRRAAEVSPEYRTALIELAAALEKAGRLREAIALYEQFPEDLAARERLGNLLLETGETDRAIQLLQQVVEASPTPASRFALALAYVRKRQLQQALSLLEQVLEEAPDNYDVRMLYGRVLRDLKNYQQAAEQFSRCVQLQPNSREAWGELAAMLVLLDRQADALAALDQVEKLGDAPPGIYFLRAIIFDKARQYEAALLSYEKFLELSRGQNPDQEFQARQRIRIIRKELGR